MPKILERHIDCFPWRRKLFEHFGIRRQKDKKLDAPHSKIDEENLPHQYNGVRYLKHQLVTLEQYGFTDVKYNRFPYTEYMETTAGNMPTGKLIYTWLQKSFNCAPATYPHHHVYNTLIVYTMDRIEDKEQAGHCIVNFYNNITKPMWEKHCFCGDRVAILGQPNRVWDDPKDNQKGVGLPYNVSDLIRLGMDQATYEAENKRIKTEDYLNPTLDFTPDPVQTNNVEIQVKSHIRNRAFQLNPDNPIYVTYLKDGIQRNIPKDVVAAIEELDDKASNNEHYFFCLYHVMLDTLRYANEIVVDLSSNSIQSMFWLGAAHGSDIYAVTVRHEMTEQEKPWSGDQSTQKDRTILDISGLWTAIFRRNETANFYKQLELIQLGIDQHARLKLPEMELESFEKETLKQLYQPSPFAKWGKEEEISKTKNPRINEIHSSFIKKNRAESRALESYYRDRFWRQMHRDNQLHLFLDLHPTKEEDEPKSMTSKWDLDAIAELSQYLSKRKVISRYQIDTLKADGHCGWNDPKSGRNAAEENFIVIGSAPKPLQHTADGKTTVASLSEYIKNHKKCRTFLYDKAYASADSCPNNKGELRFFSNETEKYEVQFLKHWCISGKCTTPTDCIKTAQTIKNCTNKIFPIIDDSENGTQYLLPAQLLLWREKQTGSPVNYKYHVSLCGVSGPATKALTALLVDEEQKWSIWSNGTDSLNKDVNEHLLRYLPLNTLQTHVRTRFFDKFMRSIDILSTEKCRKDCKDKCIKPCSEQCPAHTYSCPKKCWSGNAEWNDTHQLICKDDCAMHREGCANGNSNTCSEELNAQCTHNLQIAKHLSLTYLSTVLPQYFFPFLSHSDEKRIYHGLEAFLRMTGGQDTAMFEEAINQHTSTILDALKEALFQFRGVDALYGVSVSAKTPSSSNTDDRNITDIRLLIKDGDDMTPVINCLYVDDKPD